MLHWTNKKKKPFAKKTKQKQNINKLQFVTTHFIKFDTKTQIATKK